MAMKLLLLLAVFMRSVLGFYSTQESGKIGDFSHQSITERALYESAAVFIRTYINAGNKYASRSGVDVTVDFIRGGKLLKDYLDKIVNRNVSIIKNGYVIFFMWGIKSRFNWIYTRLYINFVSFSLNNLLLRYDANLNSISKSFCAF